jgi:hypothetical protein
MNKNFQNFPKSYAEKTIKVSNEGNSWFIECTKVCFFVLSAKE